jgi:hypothetical protein
MGEEIGALLKHFNPLYVEIVFSWLHCWQSYREQDVVDSKWIGAKGRKTKVLVAGGTASTQIFRRARAPAPLGCKKRQHSLTPKAPIILIEELALALLRGHAPLPAVSFATVRQAHKPPTKWLVLQRVVRILCISAIQHGARHDDMAQGYRNVFACMHIRPSPVLG